MKTPVFVVGCPRSGTTLLYSMLVAAGGFAAYRKETYFYALIPRFPDLTRRRARDEFAREFLAGYLGRVPGLDVAPLVRAVLARTRTAADFLPALMGRITSAQRMDRWVEATPVHVLHMDEILRAVPDALFVHVVRDGRDCAISHLRQGWIPTLPWDRTRRIGVAALYWEWMVRAGRAFGRAHPDRYFELSFESLIADPHATLDRLGRFLDHDLAYGRIREHPIHALVQPNTSFRDERGRADFNPVGRWKDKCSAADLALCEGLVGPLLQELGYPLAGVAPRPDLSSRWLTARLRATYLPYFSGKQWLKSRTPLGRYLTSTATWREQPRPDEQPVWPIPSPVAAS